MKLSQFKQAKTLTPLYGHDNIDSAYVVEDYPYGRLRTQKRFWLEHKPKKGWRFMGQTLNPKTQRWNKPKASTYTDFAGAMYLDVHGHVQWTGLGRYSSAEEVSEFVQNFPKSDLSLVKKVVPLKIKNLEKLLSGEAFFTINNKKVETTDADRKRYTEELTIWQAIAKRI